MSQRMQQRIALAAYDGVPPPDTKPVWVQGMCKQTGEQVGEQRLWFNAALRAAGSKSRMHDRSTMDTEAEAIAWAESGLVRWRDALNGTRIQGHGSFCFQYPTLVQAYSWPILQQGKDTLPASPSRSG